PASDSGAAGAAARRRNALERLAALRDELHLDAELVYVEARSVRQGLHDTARARSADLLVVGASRYDVIYRDLVGDDAREVLENAPCAIAVAPVGYSSRRGPLRTIGVAYDDSSESARTLVVAKDIALDCHAKVSVFQTVSGLQPHDPVHLEDSIEYAECGDPAQELGRYGQSVDLLVLGADKHGPGARWLGQGTVRRLADEPPCPLLVLPRAQPTS
ncbi:MAG TPA: universal stress protein, partial [Candidatus Limnocylindrales bacterium]|nr:universal stress protein [Candidatus Limnocylindrales bacterium]